jgi:hypothetical protein
VKRYAGKEDFMKKKVNAELEDDLRAEYDSPKLKGGLAPKLGIKVTKVIQAHETSRIFESRGHLLYTCHMKRGMTKISV